MTLSDLTTLVQLAMGMMRQPDGPSLDQWRRDPAITSRFRTLSDEAQTAFSNAGRRYRAVLIEAQQEAA